MMTKTQRFRYSLGYLVTEENFIMFVKQASLVLKCCVFDVMLMRL